MAIDYVQWIKDALERNPRLNQSGLARHLGRHRSAITQMLNGERDIKAREIAQIAAYLGEPEPGAASGAIIPIAVAGVIGSAWYEPGEAPDAEEREIAPMLGVWPGVAQIAYEVETGFPAFGIAAGAIVVCVPVDRSRKPQAGQIVVCKRERAGLVNLTLAKAGADDLPGAAAAIVIEVRMAV